MLLQQTTKMQKAMTPSQVPKDKQLKVKIPESIQKDGPLLGAVYVQFAETQCLTAYNSKNLYFLEIVRGMVAKYSSFAIPNIVDIVGLIKGYLLVVTKEQKLWLFQVKKNEKKIEPVQGGDEKAEQKSQKILAVQSFKQIYYHSFCVREVTPNMVQLFIVALNPEKADKVLYIYQFTIKQKVGVMAFSLDKNYKMLNDSRRQQLYATKSYFDPSINSIIKLKNFSDMNFTTRRITEEYLYVIPVLRTEDYYCLNERYQLFNSECPEIRKKVKEEFKGFSLSQALCYLNFTLLKDSTGRVGLFQIKQSMKIRFLGFQSDEYHWKICFSGKLVGVKKDNQEIVVTEELSKRVYIPPLQLAKVQSPKIEYQASKSCQDLSKLQIIPPKQETKLATSAKKGKIKAPEIVTSQEPEQSKQKSTFKPTKIISRKDIKKQSSSNLADTQMKNQETPSPTFKQLEKQQQGPLKSQQRQQQLQILAKQLQIQHKDKPDLPPAIFTEQVKQKQSQKVVEKEQLTISPKKQQSRQFNPFMSQNSLVSVKTQGNSLKNTPEQPKSNSPFSKKKNTFTVANNLLGPTNPSSMFVPPVSYEEIFGFKNSSAQKIGAPLFFKTNQPNQVGRVSPFKKKQETLVIEDSVIKKQAIKQEQKEQKTELIKKEQPLPVKQAENIQPKVQQKETDLSQQLVKSEQCCHLFEQTKSSLDLFSCKMLDLETKSQQMKKEYKEISERVIQQLSENFKKTQGQILQLSQQKAIKTTKLALENSVNEYMSKKLTPKVNQYFSSIMKDSKKIYDNTLKFYSDKRKETILSLQNHLQQQQHLIREIKMISSDMLASVENTISEGEESHAYLLKDWDQTMKVINAKLDANVESLNNHTQDRSASERQKIMDSLGELRESIQLTIQMKQKEREREKEKEKERQYQKLKEKQKAKQKIKKSKETEQDHKPSKRESKKTKQQQASKIKKKAKKPVKQYRIPPQYPYPYGYPY